MSPIRVTPWNLVPIIKEDVRKRKTTSVSFGEIEMRKRKYKAKRVNAR
jgi:hypothetical protein